MIHQYIKERAEEFEKDFVEPSSSSVDPTEVHAHNRTTTVGILERVLRVIGDDLPLNPNRPHPGEKNAEKRRMRADITKELEIIRDYKG